MVSKVNMKKEEIKVKDRKVSCEGALHPYDHPKIYLEIPENKKQIECPYCSRMFKFSSK